MIVFQLDQCLDSKRFVRECSTEGLCQVQRLPPALRNEPDAALLTVLMGTKNPILTFDRELPQDHATFIPDENPGIIVLSNFPSPQTMTVRIAQRLLQGFKSAFPDWHQVAWRNSVVEITSIGVEVWHVSRGALVRNGYQGFDNSGWQERLKAVLAENSRRGST